MMYEQFLPLITTIIVIAIGWALLRYLLRLTKRIFSCGCLAVLGVGVLLLALRYFGTV